MLRVCLIEDDAILGESLVQRFEIEGVGCEWIRYGKPALGRIRSTPYSLVLSDVRLPDMSGAQVFRDLRATEPFLPPFLFITGYGAVDEAVALLKQGAADYVRKPFDLEHLLERIRKLALPLADTVQQERGAELGISPAMRKIEEVLPKLARHARTILLTGESGVGKEVVARALHRLDPRTGGNPFVAVNCAGLTESLLEAELFGFERGAFTGAVKARRGVFEMAEGGTLFLDEVGDMPASMQAKILRTVQDRVVVRIGGEKAISVNVRLLCATHRDLPALVARGEFREDLYYRVNTIELRVPPLRDRPEDIPWLARRFWETFAREQGLDAPYPGPSLESQLRHHDWPGNARELKHVVERACLFSQVDGPQTTLNQVISLGESAIDSHESQPGGPRLAEYLARCERLMIAQRLAENAWQIGRTADSLGITRKNLWERMRRLEISRPLGAQPDAPQSTAVTKT